jgi:hypothetical protein
LELVVKFFLHLDKGAIFSLILGKRLSIGFQGNFIVKLKAKVAKYK